MPPVAPPVTPPLRLSATKDLRVTRDDRRRGPIRRGGRSLLFGLLCVSLFAACEQAGPETSLEAIREMQARGEFAASLEPLRSRLAEAPGDAESSYLYGVALAQTGQVSLATWPLRQAMRDPDWMLRAGMQLAYGSLVTNDFNEVVDVTSEILEAHPEHLMALLLRAQAHAHWKKDPEAAVQDARLVLEIEPQRLEAYEPLILGLLSLGRTEEAREALDEAGAKLEESEASDPQMAWHCSTTALLVMDEGDLEAARKIWDDCLERYPSDPNVVQNAASFFEGQGDQERSIGILRGALEAEPGQRMFRTALAERLRRVGESDEGEALLREATTEDDPRVAVSAWLDLAQYLHAQRELDRAADALASAIEVVQEGGDEPAPQLWFRYADALLLAGEVDRALETAEAISVPAQRGLIEARVLQERGESARALEKFDEVLRLWPDNASARYYAAVAAEKTGDFDRAIEEYRYAIRVSVGATDARTRAARQLIAEGQPLLAYQLLFLEAGKYPLEPEGEMLSMYLMGRVANPKQLQSSLTTLAQRQPARVPLALARGAEGIADAAGPRAALSFLSSAPGIDLIHPANAPILRVLVRFAHEAGQPELARRFVEAAREAYPGASVAHEIAGRHLELAGASTELARAAYSQAVQIDPDNARALAGLGRLVRQEDPERALDLFERAVEADPSEAEPALAAARVLQAQGREDEAEQRLEALLDRHPFEAEAASASVELDLARGRATAETLERARRATRFGGGAAAWDRLARVHAALGEPDRSREAAETAQQLREASRPAPATDRAERPSNS